MYLRETLNFRMEMAQQMTVVQTPPNGRMFSITFMTDGHAASATCHFQEQADHYLLLEGIHVFFVQCQLLESSHLEQKSALPQPHFCPLELYGMS